MGEVTLQQPDPFDIYIDNKSRDILFRDAAYILIRKILPKGHLVQLFPDSKRKIMAASSNETEYENYSEKTTDLTQKDFSYKDMSSNNSLYSEAENELVEFFEMYEKEKVPYINLFYRIPPDESKVQEIQQQAEILVQKKQAEMQVKLKETIMEMQNAVQAGKMLPERMELEMQKEQEMVQKQLESIAVEVRHQLQEEASKVDNKIITKKEYDILIKDNSFKESIVDAISFHKTVVKLCWLCQP